MNQHTVIDEINRLRSQHEQGDQPYFADLVAMEILAIQDQDEISACVQQIVMKMAGLGRREVLERLYLNGPTVLPGYEDILTWSLAIPSIDGFGRMVDFAIRRCQTPVDLVADWIITRMKSEADEHLVNSLSFGLWVIYCGARMGVDTAWKIEMHQPTEKKQEMQSLLRRSNMTDYARQSLTACLQRHL